MRPIIHSTKHYVQMSLSTVTTAAVNTEVLIQAVESTVANTVKEVAEGTIIKAVYVELWAIGSVSNQFFTIVLEKRPSGLAGVTIAEIASLGTYDNKKNVLYTTQGLASNDGIAAPIPVIRQWFKIPKGKQRFGLQDILSLGISSRGSDDVIYCGFATYKEYS